MLRRIRLAGGCYVVPAAADGFVQRGNWHECWIVNRELGGDALSMLRVRVEQGESPVRRFPGSDCAVFVLRGRGTLIIAAHEFALQPHDGAYIAPGETFALRNPHVEPIELVLTICPQCEEAQWPASMQDSFDAAHPQRVVGPDAQTRHATADRHYQVLVDERVGCRTITQFIGTIPQSRAPEHYHHYEETLAVLSGSGFMWTGAQRAPVGPDALVYLPRGQRHCMECTDPNGMLLAGMFYPSGSPAVRYEQAAK